MGILFAALAATFAGPFLAAFARRYRHFHGFFDGFVFVALIGIALFIIVPEAIHLAGGWSILGVAVGAGIPLLSERVFHRHGGVYHRAFDLLAFAGLGLHVFMDGAAVSTGGHHHHGGAVPLAVILHRLPVGMAIASRIPNKFASWLLIFGIGAGTLVGYFAGATALPAFESSAFGWFQAVVAGMLLHVALDPDPHQTPNAKFASGIGAIAAGLAGWVMIQEHPLSEIGLPGDEVMAAFVSLAATSAPALLIGFAAAGLVPVLVKLRATQWLQQGGKVGQSVRGVIFGIPVPLCSCGVVPVYKSLLSAGVPVAAGIAFFIATPELSLDAFFLSGSLLGWPLAFVRLATAAAVAVAVGVIFGTFVTRQSLEGGGAKLESLGDFREGFRYAFGELFEHTMPWVVVGLLAAAVVEPLLTPEALAAVPSAFEVPLAAVLGMPIYICASGATPFAAVLLHKGMSAGAVVALLLTGPATNVTTFGVIARIHSRKAAALLGGSVLLVSVVAGWLVDWVGVPIPEAGLITNEHGGPTWWEYASLLIVTALLLRSVLRRGIRAFVGELAMDVHGAHDHSH